MPPPAMSSLLTSSECPEERVRWKERLEGGSEEREEREVLMDEEVDLCITEPLVLTHETLLRVSVGACLAALQRQAHVTTVVFLGIGVLEERFRRVFLVRFLAA